MKTSVSLALSSIVAFTCSTLITDVSALANLQVGFSSNGPKVCSTFLHLSLIDSQFDDDVMISRMKNVLKDKINLG